METSDTYKTISSSSKGIFRDRGSRFIGIAAPVTSQDEIKSLLEEHRKSYHDARHHCYAWMIGHERNNYRTNDDGEPSGTAGKPILGQINSKELTNILIVVIRYFGGTLLGTSGLINAYRSAAAEAINNTEIEERTVNSWYRLKFPYSSMNDVMKIIKDGDLDQSEQIFELNCSMKIGFRLSAAEHILSRFNAVENLFAEFIETH
jgi:uncharacterized YigZ family protein